MSNPLFVAIVICVSGSADPPCDYSEWVDDGSFSTHDTHIGNGYSAEECDKALDQMKERGNIVKMCVPEDTFIGEFHVEREEWDR